MQCTPAVCGDFLKELPVIWEAQPLQSSVARMSEGNLPSVSNTALAHPAGMLRACSYLHSFGALFVDELEASESGTRAMIERFGVLRKLDLGNNRLSTLPAVLPSTLLTLFCLNNNFETIPPAIAELPHLRMLSFKSCRLRDVGVAPLPPSLVWLILTDNELVTLPDSLGRLTRMRKLMLANNHLASLPSSLAAMRELELLRLANNQLKELPAWLYELPRLTWLAIAGNPFVAPAPLLRPAVEEDGAGPSAPPPRASVASSSRPARSRCPRRVSSVASSRGGASCTRPSRAPSRSP
jgi:hypothetical protein